MKLRQAAEEARVVLESRVSSAVDSLRAEQREHAATRDGAAAAAAKAKDDATKARVDATALKERLAAAKEQVASSATQLATRMRKWAATEGDLRSR